MFCCYQKLSDTRWSRLPRIIFLTSGKYLFKARCHQHQVSRSWNPSRIETSFADQITQFTECSNKLFACIRNDASSDYRNVNNIDIQICFFFGQRFTLFDVHRQRVCELWKNSINVGELEKLRRRMHRILPRLLGWIVCFSGVQNSAEASRPQPGIKRIYQATKYPEGVSNAKPECLSYDSACDLMIQGLYLFTQNLRWNIGMFDEQYMTRGCWWWTSSSRMCC